MRGAWCGVAILMLSADLRADHRFTIVPSLEMTEVSDDNLNFSPDQPLSDQIRRVTPALDLRFESPRWSVRSAYSLDSERFPRHSALDNNRARERAGVSVQYRTAPRLTLSTDSDFLDTNTAADLNADTGLAASRVRGRRLSVSPSARFRISPTLTATASASSVRMDVVNGNSQRSQVQTVELERRVTARDAFSLTYEHSHLVFEGLISDTLNTHTLLAGWTRDLGVHDRFSFHVGPRVSGGSRSADVAASLTHMWRSSSIAISAQRNQTTVIGYAGAVDAESAIAKFTLSPNRHLSAYAAPAIFRSTHGQLQGTVYRMAAGARYAVSPLLGVDVSYSRDTQNGAIDPVRANARFSHGVLSVGFTTRFSGADGMR